MKRIALIMISAYGLLLTSCATVSHMEAVTGVAALSAANFKYVETISADGTAVYLLGFAGGSAAGNAERELRNKAHGLAPNQALANVTVVETSRNVIGNKFFGLMQTVTVKVKADIIEFLPEGATVQPVTVSEQMSAAIQPSTTTVPETPQPASPAASVASVASAASDASEITEVPVVSVGDNNPDTEVMVESPEDVFNRLYHAACNDIRENNAKAALAKYKEALAITKSMNSIPDNIASRLKTWENRLKYAKAL